MNSPASSELAGPDPAYVADAGYKATKSLEMIGFIAGIPTYRNWPVQQLNQAGDTRIERLKGQLQALFLHWQWWGNPHLVIEAITISIETRVDPPTWALDALVPLHDQLVHPERYPGVANGHRRQLQQYQQIKTLDLLMRAMHKLCKGCGHFTEVAARRVTLQSGSPIKAETLARYYRDDWRPFYRSLGLTGPMTRAQKARTLARYPRVPHRRTE